ncbi:hypothetical protein PVAR5_8491 [Paecilomyces variotii No. 5]|uniref:Uncharacterized protein n=1 Tax=Byssochlamys spectabilis (strain No. 5 / NBRC 109023) TaxID=1356009 RepID=V5I5Y2_BYSSN|nr:hypothetical protein PVAR5_8491 [Paecilomyces variotii No. 5]
MSVPILALLFTAFNAWGFYAGIPGTNINPTRTIGERFFGSLQLTSSIYVFHEMTKYVHSLPDEPPQVGGDTYGQNSITSDSQEPTFGDHGRYTDSGHIFVSFPPEAETSAAPASSTALPRQTPDEKAYERRVYVLENPVRPQGRGAFLDDPNNLPWIIVGLSWMFIFTMNIKQGDARSTWPRDPNRVFDTLPETIAEPIKKSAEAMNICLKAINDMAEKYEKLPLTDIRQSHEKLSQTQVFVNDFQQKLQELIDLKKEETSSQLDRALRDIHSLQEENKSLTDRMSNVQGQLQVMQSQWKPQKDFGPRIDAIEKLFEDRLKRAEKLLDSLDNAASTATVLDINDKMESNYEQLRDDYAYLQKDLQKLYQDSARKSDVQPRQDKMRVDIAELWESLEGVRSDLDGVREKVTKETPQASDSTHKELTNRLQEEVEELQKAVQMCLYPTVSTPLSNQPGLDRVLRNHFREFERRLMRLEMECLEKFAKVDDIVSAAPAQSSGGESVQDAQRQHANSTQVPDSSKASYPHSQTDVADLKKEVAKLKNELEQSLANTHSADQLKEQLDSTCKDINERLNNVSENMQILDVQKIQELRESNMKELVDIQNTVNTLQKSTEERFATITSSLESLSIPQEEELKLTADQLDERFASLNDEIGKLIKRIPTAKKVDDMLKVGNLERKKFNSDLTQLRQVLMHFILTKADSSSVGEVAEGLGSWIYALRQLFERCEGRLDLLDSKVQTEQGNSKQFEAGIFGLGSDLNSVHEEIDTIDSRLAELESRENLEGSVHMLCGEVIKLQKHMQELTTNGATTESVTHISEQIEGLKEDVEHELAKYNASLRTLQDDLTAKETDIEFVRSEIEKLNTTGTTRSRTLGSQIIPEKELKEVQVKVDSANEKIIALERGQTVLERKINPIVDKCAGHGVRLSNLEERSEQEQRALRGVAKDVDNMMLKLKNFDAPSKSATTEVPKVESQQPMSEEKKELQKESTKKETSRPSTSSAKETPEKRGPGLSASRWATDMPTSPVLTPEEAHEFSRIQYSKKRGARK